jgi:hypothetical protein
MRTSVLRAKSPARESYSDGILPLVEMDAGKQAWPSRRLLRSGSTFGWHGGGSVSCLPTIRISPVIGSTSPAAARAPALRARPAAEIRAHRVFLPVAGNLGFGVGLNRQSVCRPANVSTGSKSARRQGACPGRNTFGHLDQPASKTRYAVELECPRGTLPSGSDRSLPGHC